MSAVLTLSQNLMDLSREPVARMLPSGENEQHMTVSVWPGSSAVHFSNTSGNERNYHLLIYHPLTIYLMIEVVGKAGNRKT